MDKKRYIKDLQIIPGVGKAIAEDLYNIGIKKVDDLIDMEPEALYEKSNKLAGEVQDRCLLYAFRCAVYFAETPAEMRDAEMLKWWNWNDSHLNRMRL